MKTLVDASPTNYIAAVRERSYLRPKDLPGSPGAARKALSRAAEQGNLVRCARGLYWKGPLTRYGMAAPDKVNTALEILGVEGTGPAGFTAARTWGLTTQVPARTELSTVSARTITSLQGVKINRRTNGLRRPLNYMEIGLLEVLRDTNLIESGWLGLVNAVTKAAKDGHITPDRLTRTIAGEPRAVRNRWAKLELTIEA